MRVPLALVVKWKMPLLALTTARKFCRLVTLGVLSLILVTLVTPAIATDAVFSFSKGSASTSPRETVGTAAAPQQWGRHATEQLEAGRALYEAGRFSEAAAAWQRAAKAYEMMGDRPNQALSLSYLSLAYQELAQWDAAQEAVAASLNLLQAASESGVDAILWAQALNTQASLLLALGDPQSALETWQQAEAFYQQAGDTTGVLGSQVNQALALQSLGFYRRSRELLEQVTKQVGLAPASPIKVRSLRSLGVALQVIGELEASRDSLEQSLAIAQQIDASVELSAIFLSLGTTANALGDRARALDYFEQAEQTALNPLDILRAQQSQLDLYIALAQWPAAISLALQIPSQLADLPPSRTSIYAAISLVESSIAIQRGGQAIPLEDLNALLAEAVQAARSLDDQRAEAFALNTWGKLYALNQQWPEAVDQTQAALAIAQSIDAADIVSQVAWQLGQILAQQGRRQQAIAAYEEAVNALQTLRGDLVAINADIQFSFRENVEPVYRELVDLLLYAHPSQENLRQARELIEALQLAELDNFFREACLDTQPVSIDEVDPTAAVIYPIILPDRLAVIVSPPGQPLRYYATSRSKAEIESTVDLLLASLNIAYDRRERLRLSKEVYGWLVQPAEMDQTLSSARTLVFVLDGPLRNVPVTALHDGQSYLIEKYQVAFSPGLQLLETRSPRQKTYRSITGGMSEARQGFNALPAVELEVQKIAEAIPSSVLLNQLFTQKNLAEQINNKSANIVHLATHGQFSSSAEDTFLLTWKGRINVKELDELLDRSETSRPRAIELLVLSACETAAGDDRAALGLAGFAVQSGVLSTLATLWTVEDESTALFMTQFYKLLQRPDVTKAEAVQRAQLTLLASPHYAEPYFWAPFVLVGNWL